MKNLKNLGKALDKNEQIKINGGRRHCVVQSDCGANECCSFSVCYSYGTPGHKCTLLQNPWG